MTTPMSPPSSASGFFRHATLQSVFGSDQLDPEHLVSKCLSDRHGVKLLEWLETRYCMVFDCPRVTWQSPRREELLRKLRCSTEFAAEDAVVQVVSTLVAHPHVEIVVQAEGVQHGERRADLLLTAPEMADVEVTQLREKNVARDVDAVASAIMKRLGEAVGQEKPAALAMIKVRKAHAFGKRILDARMEKALVDVVARLLQKPLAGEELVALTPTGEVFRYDGRRSLHGVLAEIALRPSKTWIPAVVSTLRPVTGMSEALRVVKKKRERQQFDGSRPFVVVVDRTSAPFMGEDEVRAGIIDALADTTAISAVVVQHRRLTTTGYGWEPNARWSLAFESVIVPNTRARLPLSDPTLGLFVARTETQCD